MRTCHGITNGSTIFFILILGKQDMNIAHEIAKNIKADCIDDLIDLDYEGRFLRRKKLSSNTGEEFLVELPETHSLSENDSFLFWMMVV